MQKIPKHLLWLKSKKDFISINKIESELKMPQGTIAKWVRGERGLDESWIPVLVEWVKEFKKITPKKVL